jgi:hypothetical protein
VFVPSKPFQRLWVRPGAYLRVEHLKGLQRKNVLASLPDVSEEQRNLLLLPVSNPGPACHWNLVSHLQHFISFVTYKIS